MKTLVALHWGEWNIKQKVFSNMRDWDDFLQFLVSREDGLALVLTI